MFLQWINVFGRKEFLAFYAVKNRDKATYLILSNISFYFNQVKIATQSTQNFVSSEMLSEDPGEL